MTNEIFEIYNVSYSWTVEDATNLTAAEVNDTLPEYLRFNDNSLIVVLVYSALFVVAAVGNLSVFISLFRSRRRKSRISLMIRHLTIADLMVTFIMIPLENINILNLDSITKPVNIMDIDHSKEQWNYRVAPNACFPYTVTKLKGLDCGDDDDDGVAANDDVEIVWLGMVTFGIGELDLTEVF
ncbi:neuropeptide receptor-related g-protein coupled receptor [Holotrichia oblita]|uniref:Neuropeptide receptor-related g-protein coupled receptor n=1 Tax=Holotrichia oblita TaxID=644536 RepID=A0ACB9ST53_HOLOL|nr:neuropeptide receptor-related g-protein coupled receptor [Holotrichia oblita]